MKINQKSLQYILLLLIVVIAVAAYRFGFVYYTDKAAEVEAQNKNLQTRLAELRAKQESRDIYVEGIAAADNLVKDTLAKYGPGNTPEKSIVMVSKLEKAVPVQISSITFSENTPIFVSLDTDENGAPVVELDKTNLFVNYSTTYQGLKDLMDFVNNYPERMVVSSFTAAYDQETAGLSGSLTFDLYSVHDKDHEYSEPTVGGVEIGTDNIFGTLQ